MEKRWTKCILVAKEFVEKWQNMIRLTFAQLCRSTNFLNNLRTYGIAVYRPCTQLTDIELPVFNGSKPSKLKGRISQKANKP